MKNKLTRALLVAIVAASGAASAATATQASPFAVTLPNLTPGVMVNLQGLLFQPTDSNLVYVASTTGSTTVNVANNSVTPSYDFGFGVGLGYIFPQSGNDVQVNWQHFDQSSDDSVGTITAVNSGTTALTAASNVGFKFDTVDLDVGQYLDIGTRFRTRLFAGLRYANLKENTTNTYTSSTVAVALNQNSKFEGLGPHLGLETNYHVNNNFGVVTKLGASLLVGRVTQDASVAENSVVTDTFNPENQTRIVPALDAKLGFDYTIPFKNQTSSMTIEAGYQVTQYFDPIDKANGSVTVASPVLNAPVTASAFSGTSTSSNFGYNGPYLNLNFKL